MVAFFITKQIHNTKCSRLRILHHATCNMQPKQGCFDINDRYVGNSQNNHTNSIFKHRAQHKLDSALLLRNTSLTRRTRRRTRTKMQRISLQIRNTCAEADIYNARLSLDYKNILDVGCGDGRHSRDIATGGKGRTVLALDVDQVQNSKNLDIISVPNLKFAFGGAEDIPSGNAIFDVVFFFKSLHRVPMEFMGKAMQEIYRVLKPGGRVYISEPFHDGGDLMEMVRLFHNEQKVQERAFEAICDAVKQGLFEPAENMFFNTPLTYSTYQDFEDTHIKVSSRVRPEVRAAAKRHFASHFSRKGCHFVQPLRVAILQKRS